MVGSIARFRFAPEDRAEIAEILKQLAGASRREEGYATFIPHHVVDDPDVVLVYSNTATKMHNRASQYGAL